MMAYVQESAEPSERPYRRTRASIAGQACETCRHQKSKCDEQRPKCRVCRRLNVACEYREPAPMKKDNTMVHVLNSLARLELKFDDFASHHSPSGSDASTRTPNTSRNLQPLLDTSRANHLPRDDFLLRSIPRYRNLTVPHKVFLWPSISSLIAETGVRAASDIQCISEKGTPWLVGLEMAKHPLPLSCGHCRSNPRLGCWSDRGGFYNPTSPLLSARKAKEYAAAYFDTFGVLYPVLDEEVFMTGVVARVLQNGFVDGDIDAVLALTVFALGQAAIEGTLGGSISSHDGGPSGFRGGSVENPPGIELFCEARRRLGFVVTSCSLENIQILLLQGTYYEANARHLDFWRCVTAASMACQMLIRCQSVDWSSHRGGMLARAYWACSLSENLFHLDLDLPQTGIQALEDDVPLPYFRRAHDQESRGISGTEVHSHSQYHYLAMITLRRLIMRIHDVVHGSSFGEAESEGVDDGPPITVIHEMISQLESWRCLLPQPLQWRDNDMLEFPAGDPTSRRPQESLFSRTQGQVLIDHRYNLDIAIAQLRTRFYYARFIIYRPFVYKAIHSPQHMTIDDAECCALAIQSACLWPLTMAPPKDKKRLVPHQFTWTQNIVSILLILRMTREEVMLKRICEERVDLSDLDSTIMLMLDWVKDVKQLDGIAEWSWKILQPLFTEMQE